MNLLELVNQLWGILNSPTNDLYSTFITTIHQLVGQYIIFYPEIILDSPHLQTGYYITQRLAAIALLILLLVAACKTILSTDTMFSFLEGILRAGLIPFGVILFPKVIIQLIRTTNTLCYYLLSVVGSTDFAALLVPDNPELNHLVLFLIYAYLLYKLTIYYFGRNFKLTVLLLLSPVAVIFWVIPFTQQRFSLWWEEIAELLILQVIHAFLLLVLGILSIILPSAVTVIIQIGALTVMNQPPKFLQSMIPSSSMPEGISIPDMITKGVLGRVLSPKKQG